MAISLVGTPAVNDSGTGTGATTMPVVMPTGAVVGDLAFMIGNVSGNATVIMSGPSGWNQDLNQANSHNAAQIGIWHNTLVAGDIGATFNLTHNSTGRQMLVMLFVIRGGSFDYISSVTSVSAATNITIPSITPTVDGELRLGISSGNVTTANTAATYAPPASWTELVEDHTNVTGNRIGAFIDYIQLGAGTAGVAQGTATATTTSASNQDSVSILVQPASIPVGSVMTFAKTITIG